MMESKEFASIGAWWQGKNNKDQDEIDIVGLYAEEKKALVAEVKRQSKNFKPDLFALKIEELRKKVLFKYEIESRLFRWKTCKHIKNRETVKQLPFPGFDGYFK